MLTGQQKTFIEYVASIAKQDAPLYGIKVISPIIAQAIIESKWGQSELGRTYMNLFGIKCGSAWTGPSVNMSTHEEYVPGVQVSIRDNFRVYNSWEESIHDYFKFTSTKRYAALKNCTTPQEYCEAIKAAGYATSSSYVTTLMQCIKSYNLDIIYDNIDAPAMVPVTNTAPTPSVDYTKVINDVIGGCYGNGSERLHALAECGFDPYAVQFMVNLTIKYNRCYNTLQKVKEVINNEI